MNGVERPRSLSRITLGGISESDAEYIDANENITYGDSLELLDTIAETQITLNLFLNNKFDLAEERMVQLADKSMYHALGHNVIVFIKAMMTCDKADLERSMQVSKDACAVIERFRQKFSLSETFLSFGGRLPRNLTDEELHAELCYAECLLTRAALAFFQDDNFASFIKGALRIRSCYQIYRYCERLMMDDTLWVGRDYRVREHFEAGVLMGLGTFNLMLSTLPSKVLRLLEVVGFSGDRVVGMRELHRCAAMPNTVFASFSVMLLLVWHLIVCFMFGIGQPDLALCRRLMPPLMAKYPKGAVILFLRARLLLVSGEIDSAIYCFNNSIESQQEYKQFHHIAYWELLFAHCYVGEWAKAANYAKRLLSESRWSRCVYTYLLCILFAADTTCDESKRIETVAVLARKIDGLRQKIAGKSIPLEKYCTRKASRFIAKQTLMFAHYEFMYFWNGFDIVAANSQILQGIFEDLQNIWHARQSRADADDRALYFFLRAVCLRNLRQPAAAENSLHEVLKLESELVDFTYLPPNAIYELALLRIAEGYREEAELLLARARSYKGFSLENKLLFRIHAAMENLGSRTPMV
uniref:Tetratricopeptide repeat protein 39B n=2 Tax=Haemonchus contortus TaxID=6289 RepID=A0A7I4Y435_HAECO|nr:Outer membrane protein domain containing protein [Haemonchus contortus]